MVSLPTGTVTFLFTDIEGSTRIARERSETWEALRGRHDAILRAEIESHGGFVFQIIGDSLCAAFHTAGDALTAAIQSQIDLQTEDWGETPIRVRMGIHTGEAVTNGADYRGYLTLSLVHRVMSAGHGGQILLSNATESLLRGQLPKDATLRDLGEHRLKDVRLPVRIFQAVVPGLPGDFPALRALHVYPNNLPTEFTSFVGREKELAEIKQFVMEHRLVTLTGAGGTGKTRLALQAASLLLRQFADGIWFVELAPVTDPDLIPATIFTTLGLSDRSGQGVFQLLLDFLQEKKLVLILDNCEHLIEGSARVATTLLNGAPGLKVLASSREALGIKGELSYPVPSLSLPDPKQRPSIEGLVQCEAVRLFVDRARLVAPHFDLDEHNAPFVAQICSRLDGIPLAIELAASRVKVLSPEQIAGRLNDCFRLLTSDVRAALPRHQTLRAMIDWSYNLLSEPEATLFRRLVVFAGGWSLEAAETVCSGDGIQSEQILGLMSQLVNKSLVIAENVWGKSRYHVLETIRQYARERLLDTRGDFERVMRRHLEYFVGWSEEANRQLRGASQREWLRRMELEADNSRLALEWSMRPEYDPDMSLRLLSAVLWFWWLHGHYSEAKRWIVRILARGSFRQSPAMAHVLSWAGIFLSGQPDQNQRAQAYLDDSLRIGLELPDKASISWALMMLARLAENQGNCVNAVAFGEQALQASRELGETWYICFALERLGEAVRLAGDYNRSKSLYEESLELARKMGAQREIAVLLHNLGHVLLQQGNLEEALGRFWASLQLAKEIGEERRIIMCLEGIAGVFVQAGRLEWAAQLFGATANLRGALGADFEPADHVVYLRNVTILQRKEFETVRAEGRTMTMEQAIGLALENSRAWRGGRDESRLEAL